MGPILAICDDVMLSFKEETCTLRQSSKLSFFLIKDENVPKGKVESKTIRLLYLFQWVHLIFMNRYKVATRPEITATMMVNILASFHQGPNFVSPVGT